MQKVLLIISASVVLICLLLSMFLFWYLSPPGGAFPYKVGDLRRVAGPEYRTGETEGSGVYAAVYSRRALSMGGAGSVLHTGSREASADDAKNMIRQTRERMLKQAESQRSAGSSSARSLYLTSEDSPNNDHLVYIMGDMAHVHWAHDDWYFTVSTDAYPRLSDEPGDDRYSASPAHDFARTLPYPPKGTTPPDDPYVMGYSVYSLITIDLSILFAYWYPALIPLVLAVPFILTVIVLLIWGFVKGRKKQAKVGGASLTSP